MRLSLLYTPGGLSPLLHNSSLLLYIFTYLPPNALCELSCASKFLDALSTNPKLWGLDKFELKTWILEQEYEYLMTLPAKDQWKWCFQTFVLGQFNIGLSRNSRVRVPESCILCNKTIKPLVLRWERRRVVRDERFVAQGAELKDDQEVIYFHWSCVEPPLRFVTHYQVPGYSSLTFDAKQTVREFFDKREKQNEKTRKKQKVNSASVIVCDSCDKVCGEHMWHCTPHDDCHLCSKCFRWKSNEIQEEHAKHGTFEKVATNQHFFCSNCSKTIKDAFYFCKDCPNGHYLCTNCFRRSRTKQHDASHEFYAIGNTTKAGTANQHVVPHPSYALIEDEQHALEGNGVEGVHESPAEEEGSNGNDSGVHSNAVEEGDVKVESSTVAQELDSAATPLNGASTTDATTSTTTTDAPAPAVDTAPATSTIAPAAPAPASQQSDTTTDNDRKRKTLTDRSPPVRATKRPKKMRRFVELNKKIREDFAKRYFLDKGLDLTVLPQYDDFVRAKAQADALLKQQEIDAADSGSVASRKKIAASTSIGVQKK